MDREGSRYAFHSGIDGSHLGQGLRSIHPGTSSALPPGVATPARELFSS